MWGDDHGGGDSAPSCTRIDAHAAAAPRARRCAKRAGFGSAAATFAISRRRNACAGSESCRIEYEVHGTILATGVRYDNRFGSIIRVDHRKIAHWRDDMDSLAAWNALTAR
jgi:hypothetical protein